MNCINLVGRLTKEPEIKTTANGNKVITFCLAVDRKTKNKETDFIDCVAWNKLAEVISKYCHKGKMISVTGSLQTRNWEDSNGSKHKASEVNVISMDLLGGGGADKASETAVTVDELDVDAGQLPFSV